MSKQHIWIVLVMVIIAALFGSIVSGIYLGSRETLERNRRIRLQRAYVEAFDLGDPDLLSPEEITELVETRIDTSETRTDPESGWTFTLIKAYASPDQAQLKGVGFRFRGLGFWAPIEGILTITPDLAKTMDIFILQQQETPGLGGRIEEPIFTGQFEAGLKVSPPENAAKWLEISATPPADNSPMAGRHVDAITGATQTGIAMERILNEHLARFHRAMQSPN